MMGSKYTLVTDLKEIPQTQHWAIIKLETVTIPGDERSRTNPGHGYPEERRTFVKYYAYSSEEEWSKEIERIEKSKADGRREDEYKAMKVLPATVSSKVTVTTRIE